MNRKKSMGFTLMEIMIVLVIVGIIASIALPSLFGNVLTVNRKAAIVEMNDISQQLERGYVNNNGAYLAQPIIEQPEGYVINVNIAANGQTYIITARASNNQADDGCGTLTLDSSGLRTVSETGATVARCFR